MAHIPAVRSLTIDDLAWMTATAAARRSRLSLFAPRLWRAAADAATRHADYLRQLLESSAVLGLRTDRCWALAVPQGGQRLVDDMVVADGSWEEDGLTLLRRMLDAGPVRFVAPEPEPARVAAAECAGLRAVECWWHRDIGPMPGVAEQDIGSHFGFADAALVPAPPVYDPGGPVVLVRSVPSVDVLARVEAAAVAHGTTVSVVSTTDDSHDDQLLAAGYVRTTWFCAQASADRRPRTTAA